MVYLLVLLPVTGLTVAGYVVLFLSARSEGAMRTFGKYLGFWAFILAALLVLGAIFAAGRHHHCPFAMHEPMHGAWSGPAEHCPESDAGSTPPAAH
jgi:hypothetical protein